MRLIQLTLLRKEYCCQIWNPHFDKDIGLTEGVQWWATKLVKGMENLHYDWKHLGLTCLDRRRSRSDLIETFKIISGIYIRQLFLTLMKVTDDIQKKLFKRRSSLGIRKFVFSNRVVDKWNSLSDCCINCTTVNSFQSHISNLMESETSIH